MITLGNGRDGRWALLRDGVSPTHAALVAAREEWATIEAGLRAHKSCAAGDAVFKANELGGWKAWSKQARSGDVVVLTTLEALALADAVRELAVFGRDAGDRDDLIARARRTVGEPVGGKRRASDQDDDELIDEDPTDDPVDALRMLLVAELQAEARYLEHTTDRLSWNIAQSLERLANRITKARVS